ncbi:STAS domain-containing protein [Streptomyces sp. NPDC002138]|uniref:STAS domain-containing protein n=1 Tax=Streptomyces sp. NPDC002138 TaxID=3154410 RepID=UPI00332E64B4
MGLKDFALDVTEQPERPERTVVSVSGDIDYETCSSLTRVVDTLVLPGRTLVLDLARVTFLGTSALPRPSRPTRPRHRRGMDPRACRHPGARAKRSRAHRHPPPVHPPPRPRTGPAVNHAPAVRTSSPTGSNTRAHVSRPVRRSRERL